MKKWLVCLLASSLLVSTAFITTAEAASKVVSFPKGKTGTSVSGKIKGSEAMDYQLHASAGQTLIVDFKASKGAAFFNVLAPGSTGEAMFVGSNGGDHFKGELPSDGDYIIRVYLMGAAEDSGKPVSYTLKISIPGSAKTNTAASTSGTAKAEKACLAAVAKQVGVSSSKLKIAGVDEAQSGIVVMINVPDATAPWKCLAGRNGKVDEVMFTGSEGAL